MILFSGFLALLLLALLGLLLAVREPIEGAVTLGGVLLVLAIFFFLLGAPYLAALEILLYLGAILVLFLFAILLLPPAHGPASAKRFRQGASGATLLLLLLGLAVAGQVPEPTAAPFPIPNITIAQLAVALFHRWLWLLEALATLLFGVIAAVLVLHAGAKSHESE